MIGTILSVVFAIFLLFNPLSNNTLPNENIIAATMVFIPLGLMLLSCLTIVWTFSPLQNLEQNSSPRLFGLLKNDRYILGSNAWYVFFILLSFIFSVDILLLNNFHKNYLLALWIIGFGISIDIYFLLLKRMMSYLNPFDNITLFTQQAKNSIANDKGLELCDAIDSITEIAVKAVKRNGTSLSNQSLQELQIIVKHFLESSKSIAHVDADAESKALGIKDRISYTLFYVLDRIGLINDEALAKKFEQVITTVVTVLGKIAIHCAKFDLTLVAYPVHYLARIAKTAMGKGLSEIGVKGSITLLEVSRTIIEEVDYTYGDLKDPFNSIIHAMEEIAKETFVMDKDTNLTILTQPFRDLKILFQNPKIVNHQDTPAILQNIDRVLGEYASLELVMKTIPPIPEIPEEQ
jgi:hypothetical protein